MKNTVELYHEDESGKLDYKGIVEAENFSEFKKIFMREHWPKYPLPDGSVWLFRHGESGKLKYLAEQF